MEAKQFIGLDVGSKRTGIARASDIAKIAEPLKTVETKGLDGVLAELIKNDDISGIVVGLPRNLQGDDTDQTAWVRQWVADAKGKIGKEFYWQDEALTSVEAEKQPVTKNHPGIDALSAAIILQDFIDTPTAERVAC